MAVFACLYALLALGLNLVWGMAGMINLGLVGFFGFGAYVSALATKRGALPIAAGLVLALALTGVAGAVMAMITARLRGDYLAIITLGFSEVVRLTALRDDDQVRAVAGKHVLRFKVEAFAVSAGVLGVAGALWGHYTSFIAPDVFVPLITIYVVLALTAGGTGNNWGAVVGAFLVVFFMEATRFATGWLPGLKPVRVAAVRELSIGAGLLIVLRFRPAGLLPERIPRVEVPR